MPPLTIVLRVCCERFPQKTLRDGPRHIRYLLTEEDQDIVEGHDAYYLVIPIYDGYASDTIRMHEGSQLMQTLVPKL